MGIRVFAFPEIWVTGQTLEEEEKKKEKKTRAHTHTHTHTYSTTAPEQVSSIFVGQMEQGSSPSFC